MSALNPPGKWDFMISYTQQNGFAKALATKLHSTLKDQGWGVWFDVEMGDRSEAAMQEAVENSSAVIAVISGNTPGAMGNAYFERNFCLKELRWAKQAGTRIQPVVDVADKNRIGEFLAVAPEDLKDIGSINFEDLNTGDADYWRLGVSKVVQPLRSTRRRSN